METTFRSIVSAFAILAILALPAQFAFGGISDPHNKDLPDDDGSSGYNCQRCVFLIIYLPDGTSQEWWACENIGHPGGPGLEYCESGDDGCDSQGDCYSYSV